MTIRFNSFVTGITAACVLFSSNIYAAPDTKNAHSHQDIRDTAIEFVRSNIPEDVVVKDISAGQIDSRIHFKQCSRPLEARTNNNRKIARHQTIGVYCNGEVPWNIHISVKANLYRNMLISKTTITRGELITAENIQLIEQEIKNDKYLSNFSNIVGHEARRTIRPYQVINSSMLQKALLVHKKESVLIYAQNQNMRISMRGTALKNGRKNEMIKVRNNSSNKIIEALVVDRGIVAINF